MTEKENIPIFPETDPRQRAEELFDRLLDKCITEEEAIELRKLWDRYPLTESAASDQYFTERQLRWSALFQMPVDEERIIGLIDSSPPPERPGENGDMESGEQALDFKRFVASSASPVRKTKKKLLYGVLSISILFVLLGLPFFRPNISDSVSKNKGKRQSVPIPDRPGEDTAPRALPEPMSSAVAVLASTVDAVWDEHCGFFRKGQPLEPGWLRLRSGIILLNFYNGAEVVVAGPAELEIVSVNQVQCRFGNINVTIPPQAQGFLVSSPQLTVRDLGTAFAVSVTPRGTEVHVIKGEVELCKPLDNLESLKEGEALFVNTQGAYQRFQANNNTFSPTRSLHEKSKEFLTLCYESWKKRRSRFNRDPELLFHFDFEDLQPGDKSLPNTVPGSNISVPDGRIIGCRITEGRWPGKKAVEFSRTSDRVRLRVPGAYESVTLSAWLRVNSLGRYPYALFAARGNFRGRGVGPQGNTPFFQWTVLTDGGIRLEIDSPIPGDRFCYDSPPYFQSEHLGEWTHLVVVVDGMRQSVTHFVNGKILGSPHVDMPFKEALPIPIGTAEIGNIPTPEKENAQRPIRNLSGCMDEFHFFSRALSREEIWDLYDPVPDWSANRKTVSEEPPP